MAIYALHGFLGLPEDWNDIFPKEFEICAPNLFGTEITPVSQWVKTFNAMAKGRNILAGYSMGGRLALHALVANPSQWEKVIIISGHPGHTIEEEKEDRLKTDTLWSQRFLSDPWDVLIKDWNNQGVLNSINVHRNETDFSREALSKAILNWSVGHQTCLIDAIEKLNIPILWITGENDHKYSSIKIKFKHPESKKSVAPRSGHRVPWQQKSWLQQEVRSFLCR